MLPLRLFLWHLYVCMSVTYRLETPQYRWKFWSRHSVICMHWCLTEHLTYVCILQFSASMCSLSTDSNLIIKRWCIVPFQRCIQQCINALMHRTRAAPHLKIASQSSSPRCLPLTANILKTTSRRHQATTKLTSPCPHHHRCAGQDDESSFWLKFCNGPGRPSQDEQTKNLHCNIGCFITRIFTIANIIIRLQIIIDESLAMLVSEMGWPMFDDF